MLNPSTAFSTPTSTAGQARPAFFSGSLRRPKVPTFLLSGCDDRGGVAFRASRRRRRPIWRRRRLFRRRRWRFRIRVTTRWSADAVLQRGGAGFPLFGVSVNPRDRALRDFTFKKMDRKIESFFFWVSTIPYLIKLSCLLLSS